MSRYINAETAEKCLISRAYESAIYNIGVEVTDAALVFKDLAENRIPAWIDNIPTADVEEVRHGEWDDTLDGITPYCSICGKTHSCFKRTPDYCPNCGAKMDGGKNNGKGLDG